MIGTTSGSKIFWTNRRIVALQSLQLSCLYDMHSRFYESSKLKKWMCELCTFSQIWSHISPYDTYLINDEKSYQYKITLCLGDHHSIEPCISVFLIINYNINSDFCLYHIMI